jgi:hypothetical protein
MLGFERFRFGAGTQSARWGGQLELEKQILRSVLNYDQATPQVEESESRTACCEQQGSQGEASEGSYLVCENFRACQELPR